MCVFFYQKTDFANLENFISKKVNTYSCNGFCLNTNLIPWSDNLKKM